MKDQVSIACSCKHSWWLRGMFIAAIAATLLTSCQKEDEEDPLFERYEVNEVIAPDTLEVMAADTLQIEVRCTDDQELNQLRIAIGTEDVEVIGQWEEFDVTSLSGMDMELTTSAVIPDSILGEWTLELQLADAAGNLADEQRTVLLVSNSLIPQIQVDAINGTDPEEFPTLFTAEQLQLEGTISDDIGLTRIAIRVYTSDSIFVHEEWLPEGLPMSWNLDQIDILAPDTALTMTLEIEAFDEAGLRNVKGYSIETIE